MTRAPDQPPRVWTIGNLLQWTSDFFARKGVDEPRLSAELLLSHVLSCTRMQLYTQYESAPDETRLARFREMVKQRAEHVPVAYLIGKAQFYSLELAVTRDVLIPRPDTETLVEQVITKARQAPGWESPQILDLCTGSGAIALALAKHLTSAQVVATDVSAKALAVAKQNVEKHELASRVTLLEGDLYQALDELKPPHRFHVIAGNPPYIPAGEMARLPATVREHEPRLALDGGADGLETIRRIVAGAREWLEPGGLLAVEIQFDQGERVEALFREQKLEGVRTARDAGRNPRCVLGTNA